MTPPCRSPLRKAGMGGSEELGLRRNLGQAQPAEKRGACGRGVLEQREEEERKREGKGRGGRGEGWDGMGWVKGRKEQRFEWKEQESGGAWPPLPEETRLNWSHYSW